MLLCFVFLIKDCPFTASEEVFPRALQHCGSVCSLGSKDQENWKWVHTHDEWSYNWFASGIFEEGLMYCNQWGGRGEKGQANWLIISTPWKLWYMLWFIFIFFTRLPSHLDGSPPWLFFLFSLFLRSLWIRCSFLLYFSPLVIWHKHRPDYYDWGLHHLAWGKSIAYVVLNTFLISDDLYKILQ